MKSKIALITYFLAALITVASNTVGFRDGMLWSKVAIVPAISFYYAIKSNYKINVLLVGILLSCYLLDIYILISPNNHTEIEILCFFSAYFLLVFYLLPDFLKLQWKHNENLALIICTSFVLIVLAYLILNLNFNKIGTNFIVLLVYGITLSFLLLISIVECFRSTTKGTFNLVVACIFFYFSDSFYVITKFYLPLSILDFVQIATQVLSYYFLVNFFILNEQKRTLYTNIDLP
jgi:hypothetical protein